MILSLRARNFQPHEDTKVVFVPGVNCVVGPSDVGKSSLVRALWWVAANEPSGTAMLRHGAGVCDVTVNATGGRVRRRRGGRVNSYSVNGKRLKAFGSTVPEDVTAALRLSPVNFQHQLDGHFWFSETAGKVSRELNAVVSLDAIDAATSHCAGECRRARYAVESARERAESAREGLNGLAHVPAMAAALDAIVARHRELVNKRDLAFRLRSIASETREHERRAQCRLAFASAGDAMLRAHATCCARRRELESLRTLVERLREAQATTARRVPDLSGLEAIVTRLCEARSRLDGLRRLATAAGDEEGRACRGERSATAARETLSREFGTRCPVCGADAGSPPS